MNAVMVRILGFLQKQRHGERALGAAGLAGRAACCAIDGNAAARIAAIRSKDLLVRGKCIAHGESPGARQTSRAHSLQDSQRLGTVAFVLPRD